MSALARSAGVDRLGSLLPPAEVRRLDNGLTVCVLADDRSPLVTTALWYRAGTFDEEPELGGTAHFLEHMMFKGTPRYGPGEIDRLTQALGGNNNATTSHDATLYYFTFAPEHWRKALLIEADRMAELTLDAEEVDSERRVIEEEIGMYESEPWDVLAQRVSAELHGGHAYGRPVLGTRETLSQIDREVLASFHHLRYRPANAVLTVAGDVGEGAFEVAAEAFGSLTSGPEPAVRGGSSAGEGWCGLRRLERYHGEVSRLFLAFKTPAADHPDHPFLSLLWTVLGSGRASRLHRALVDEGQRCAWVSADLQETLQPGMGVVAAEALPGEEAVSVEAVVWAEVDRLLREPPADEEIERGKKIALADWIFGHEKVYERALTLGFEQAFFDLERPRRYMERLLGAERGALLDVATRYLGAERATVVGWSLPARDEPVGEP